MKQQDAKPEQALPHDLILEGRNKLTVTGVRRVIRCDAEGAAMLTSKGTLELTGAELSVTSLDLDKGEVKLTPRPTCRRLNRMSLFSRFLLLVTLLQ